MSKVIEMRWFKWDRLMNENKAAQVVEEFDSMVKSGKKVVVGDVVRREQALEMMDIKTIKPLKKMIGKKDDKTGKRKS